VLERAGAAEVLEQAGLNGTTLANRVLALARDRERRARMALAARGLARPDAAARIVERAFELIGHRCAPGVPRNGA
jgi:UDP-N-acetylglucosamine--N-acetylmuramyl-(pentapeptide) pyrophosphoryl-undecaprenol N-acetylglucosamine transferase